MTPSLHPAEHEQRHLYAEPLGTLRRTRPSRTLVFLASVAAAMTTSVFAIFWGGM